MAAYEDHDHYDFGGLDQAHLYGVWGFGHGRLTPLLTSNALTHRLDASMAEAKWPGYQWTAPRHYLDISTVAASINFCALKPSTRQQLGGGTEGR